MGNITIKELLPSDKISELVDKVNFNFDQLLLNGGGPVGQPGGPGGPGPTGPRGSIWFSVFDLYTTPSSPGWTGIPTKVNNINLPNYPQYKGDPNRFLPTGLGVFPENTFTFNSTLKIVRSHDLFIQEADDNFQTFSSKDGDIWEYNGISNTWTFTGVNIKGSIGSSGSDATDEWIRTTSGPDDLLYPNHVTGQQSARVLIGDYTIPFDAAHPSASLTVVPNAEAPGPQIAIGHPSIHDNTGNIFMPTISVTSLGELVINGSQNGSGKQIIITAFDADVIINSGGTNSVGYQQKPILFEHFFSGASLKVDSIPALNDNYLRSVTGVSLSINLSPLSEGVRLYSDNGSNIIMQHANNKNVGIGPGFTFVLLGGYQPTSRLAVSGNQVIGFNYRLQAAPLNGLAVEGNVGIGTIGTGIKNNLEVNGSIDIYPNAYYGFNTYYGYNPSPGFYRTAADYSAYMKQEPGGLWHLDMTTASGLADTAFVGGTAISVYNSTRFVGINTANPTRRLTIFDASNNGVHLINNSGHGATRGSHIYVQQQILISQPPNTSIDDYSLNIVNQENKDTIFYTNNIVRQTITNTGKIIIGLTSRYKPEQVTGRLAIADEDNDSDQTDPDRITAGTFSDADVFIPGAVWVNTSSVIATTVSGGGSYIGFNAYMDNSGSRKVATFHTGEASGATANNSKQAGAMIWMDKFGNMHWIIDRNPAVSGGSGSGSGSGL